MEFLNVIAAAAAAWVFGAIWYGVMAKRWMAAAGLTDETINKQNIPAFVGSFLAALVVAGMMRHIFASSDVTTVMDGLKNGLGLGAFIAFPWIMTHYLFSQRGKDLIWIDGVYSVGGCTVIGIVLMLF